MRDRRQVRCLVRGAQVIVLIPQTRNQSPGMSLSMSGWGVCQGQEWSLWGKVIWDDGTIFLWRMTPDTLLGIVFTGC